MKMIFSITIVGILVAMLPVQAGENMKAFPPPEKGMVRYALQLPKHDDESAFKVELIVGKKVQVDEKNQYFFGGNIQEETIKGWGFPRYIVKKLGPMAGTLMAVDPNAPKVNRFITLGGGPFLSPQQKGVCIYTVKGGWELNGTIQSKVMAMAFSIASEIERDLISKRTKEALKARKAKGLRLGRPKGAGKSKLDQYREENPLWKYIGSKRHPQIGILRYVQVR